MNDDRFLELYDRYCDGAMPPAEQEEFLSRLGDPAWRGRFVELALLEAAVTEELRLRGMAPGDEAEDPVSACAAAGVSTRSGGSRRRLQALPSPGPVPRRWLWPFLAAAAVLAAVLPWALRARRSEPPRAGTVAREVPAPAPDAAVASAVEAPAAPPAPDDSDMPDEPEEPVVTRQPFPPQPPAEPAGPEPIVDQLPLADTPPGDPAIEWPPPQPWRRQKERKHRDVATRPAPVSSPAPHATETAVAQLVSLRGKVHVMTGRQGGGKSPAAVDQFLYAGHGLQTVGANSAAVLEFPDGTLLELGPETTLLRLDDGGGAAGRPGAGGKSAFLDRGSVGAEVAPQPASRPLVLATPHAEACVLGTRFTLTVSGAASRLGVHQGEVQLTRLSDGSRVRVGMDQYAAVSAGRPLAAVPLRVRAGLVALYAFAEGQGAVIHDVSGVGESLPLRIADPSAVSWIPGGLLVHGPAGIATFGPAEKIIAACKASGELTLEAWARTPDNARDGYVMALASNPYNLNVALEQVKAPPAYRIRLTAGRSAETGTPLLSRRAPPPSALRHVAYTYAADGTGTLYLDGVAGAAHRIPGGLSRWDTNFRLALASDPRGNLPWSGELRRVAVYSRALTADEIHRHFEAGAD